MPHSTNVTPLPASDATQTVDPTRWTKGEKERAKALVNTYRVEENLSEADAKIKAVRTVAAERETRLANTRHAASGMSVDGLTAEALKLKANALRDVAEVKASISTALKVIEINLATMGLTLREAEAVDKNGKATNLDAKGKTPRTAYGEAFKTIRTGLNAAIAAAMTADGDDDDD